MKRVLAVLVFVVVGNTLSAQNLNIEWILPNAISYTVENTKLGDEIKVITKDSFYIYSINSEQNLFTFIIDNLEPSEIIEVGLIRNDVMLINRHDISASNSTGVWKHFFNHKLTSGIGIEPDGTTFDEIRDELLKLIRNAKSTIDYCVYNTNEDFVVDELIDAHARGVRIRVIMEEENRNSSFDRSLPFSILKDNRNGLMHNKFIVVDGSDEMNAVVVTGSMNYTYFQMRTDPNHLMFIQDKSLALAYQMEFEEMWGSDGQSPDRIFSKFGNQKTDNTPHDFVIKGVPVKMLFSPSDQVTSQIVDEIKFATKSIDLALLLFTNWELRDAIIDQLDNGIECRLLLEGYDNSSDVVDLLQPHDPLIFYHEDKELFHYKMALIDRGGDDPVLITGSHNWTYSAETINDENLLFVYDKDITNLYGLAFDFWWQNYTTSMSSDVTTELSITPTISQSIINVSLSSKNLSNEFYIFDYQGRMALRVDFDNCSSCQIDISRLSPGVYFLTGLQDGEKILTKFTKI